MRIKLGWFKFCIYQNLIKNYEIIISIKIIFFIQIEIYFFYRNILGKKKLNIFFIFVKRKNKIKKIIDYNKFINNYILKHY